MTVGTEAVVFVFATLSVMLIVGFAVEHIIQARRH